MKYSTNQNKWLLRHKLLISMVVLLLAVIILGWVGTDYLGERARQEIIKDNESAISLLSTNLTGELKKIESAVKSMSGSPPVVSFLIDQSDRNLLAANAALDRYNSALNASISYVMDAAGKTIASSNRSEPDSFVGKSYRFRPYFMQAVQGKPGRYFGLGVTSLIRGFYASHPVHDGNNKIIGVVAMKKNLDDMETQLKSYSNCFFVNKNGVIFLSSDQNHLFKSLWPIDRKNKQSLVASRQFGDKPFDALLSQEVVDVTSITFEGGQYLASRKFIDLEDWSIVLMTPVNRIMMYRAAGIIATFLLCTIIMIPLIVSYKTTSSAEKVRESEERFRQVTLSSRGWIWELDKENRYTYSSQAVKDILDYEPEEVVGRYYDDFFSPEDKELLAQTYGIFLNGNEPFFRIVTTAVRRDGEKVVLESTGYPTMDQDGNVISFRGVSRDITDRRRAEDKLTDALKEAEGQREKFRTLVDNTPFGMVLIGEDADFILLNPRFKELFGYDEKDVPNGREWFKKAYPDPEYRRKVVDTWITDLEKSISGEKRPRVFTVTCKNGEEKIIHFVPVKLTTGEHIVSLEDITERVHAEESLKKSERLYRSVIDNIQDTFYRSNVDGCLVMMSASGAALFGYDSIEEMIGADIAEFFYVNPEDRQKLLSAIEKEGFVKDYEIKLKRRDGTAVEISASSHPYYDEQEKYLGIEGILRDITDRKRAEELYRTLADSSHAGVYIVQDRKIKFVNPHVSDYSGYSYDELIGKDIPTFVTPEDREVVRRSAVEMLKGKRIIPYEFRIIDRDGRTRWLMETVRSITYEGKRAVLGNTMDITERYRMESMLRHAQKMEAIGTLAGGIAHDFNNILGIMIGYTDLARSDVRPEKQKYYLEQVLRACDRAKGLVSQILTFSRQTEQERKPTLMASVLREGIRMLRASLPTTIEIKYNVSDSSVVVLTDPAQIHQILMNLGANAAHAMRESGGVLIIQLERETIDSSEKHRHLDLGEGEYVRMTVNDTGHGIDASTIARIFDPFFTTKGPGEGTGLGLSMVYGIVKNHGGAIDVSSEIGKGTTFNVYLPLIENMEPSSEEAAEAITGGKERILFVDDEIALVDVGSTMLTSLGYRVSSRTSSVEALELFRSRPQDFELVISDMTMPNMTGVDLARELLKIRPDIPIVLCTGFSEVISEERAKGIGVRRFVFKPLFKKDLARVIREALA